MWGKQCSNPGIFSMDTVPEGWNSALVDRYKCIHLRCCRTGPPSTISHIFMHFCWERFVGTFTFCPYWLEPPVFFNIPSQIGKLRLWSTHFKHSTSSKSPPIGPGRQVRGISSLFVIHTFPNIPQTQTQNTHFLGDLSYQVFSCFFGLGGSRAEIYFLQSVKFNVFWMDPSMATKALLGRVEVVVSLFRCLINLDLEKTNAERERERETEDFVQNPRDGLYWTLYWVSLIMILSNIIYVYI